jgi:hypothetical protein
MPNTPHPPPPIPTNLVPVTIVGSSLLLLAFVILVQMYFGQKGRDHLDSLRATHVSTAPPASYPDAPMSVGSDPGVATIMLMVPMEMKKPDRNDCGWWSAEDRNSCVNDSMPPFCCMTE